MKRALGFTELAPAPHAQGIPEIDIAKPISLKEITKAATRGLEREIILKVLQANGWSRRKTAKWLNISYRSLLYKLRESEVNAPLGQAKEIGIACDGADSSGACESCCSASASTGAKRPNVLDRVSGQRRPTCDPRRASRKHRIALPQPSSSFGCVVRRCPPRSTICRGPSQ